MDPRASILATLDIGKWVAEYERQLKDYFIRTVAWASLSKDLSDLTLGEKGSGKTALHLLLKSEPVSDDLLVVDASNVNGNPLAMQLAPSIAADDEQGHVDFWRTYLALALTKRLFDHDPSAPLIVAAAAALDDAGVSDFKVGRGEKQLSWLARMAKRYLPRIKVRASGHEIAIDDRVDAQKRLAVDALKILENLNRYLGDKRLRAWCLIDRLDAAFIGADAAVRETTAMRALFRVYGEVQAFEQLRLKLFVRDDVWNLVMSSGKEPFREASRLNTRLQKLSWDEPKLINLISRRLAQNRELADYYRVDPASLEGNIDRQKNFLDEMLPDAREFSYLLKRIVDGTGRLTPRELIHVYACMIKTQGQWYAKGYPRPAGKALFIKECIDDALAEVSNDRLKLTVFAEYPHLQKQIEKLQGRKSEFSIASLADIWGLSDRSEVVRIATQLVTIGVFKPQPTSDYTYVVPFLYRPALNSQPGREAKSASVLRPTPPVVPAQVPATS